MTRWHSFDLLWSTRTTVTAEVNVDSDGPVEACVPYVRELKPTGEIRLRVEPAHMEAFTRITKAQVAFPGILEAYEAVEKWAAEKGMKEGHPARSISPIGKQRATTTRPAT